MTATSFKTGLFIRDAYLFIYLRTTFIGQYLVFDI